MLSFVEFLREELDDLLPVINRFLGDEAGLDDVQHDEPGLVFHGQGARSRKAFFEFPRSRREQNGSKGLRGILPYGRAAVRLCLRYIATMMRLSTSVTPGVTRPWFSLCHSTMNGHRLVE